MAAQYDVNLEKCALLKCLSGRKITNEKYIIIIYDKNTIIN